MSDVGLSNCITLPLEITLFGGTSTQVRVNTSAPDNKHHIKDRPTIIVCQSAVYSDTQYHIVFSVVHGTYTPHITTLEQHYKR
jgi:hypothetical protein